MTYKSENPTLSLSTNADISRQVREAAYYNWLNRQHYAQKGSELTDWLEAEKEIQDSLKAKETLKKLNSHPIKTPAEKTPVSL